MDVIVCIKRIRQQAGSSRSSINPLDRNALEAALTLKEDFSGKVTALTMGSPPAKRALEEALAVGADEAIFICDNAFSGADTLATAYALFYGVRRLGHFDLIICGNESVTGATGHVGPQLAELLQIPHVAFVRKIAVIDGNKLEVERVLEHGHMKLQVELPALLAVMKETNRPRLPTASGIMAAVEKEIVVWSASDIGAERRHVGLEGSPTRSYRQMEKRFERRKEVFTGAPDGVVRKAVERLKELGVI